VGSWMWPQCHIEEKKVFYHSCIFLIAGQR